MRPSSWRRRIAWRALVCLAFVGSADAARAADSCPGGRDWVLTNGTILTMDAADSTVSTVRIRDKRIITVGEAVGPQGAVHEVRRSRRPHRDSGSHRRPHALRAHGAGAGPVRRRSRGRRVDPRATGRARDRREERRAGRVGHRDRRLDADPVQGTAHADARRAQCGRARPPRLHAGRLLDARSRERRRPQGARRRRHRDLGSRRRRARRRGPHVRAALGERRAHEAPLPGLHELRDLARAHDRRRSCVLRLARRAL